MQLTLLLFFLLCVSHGASLKIASKKTAAECKVGVKSEDTALFEHVCLNKGTERSGTGAFAHPSFHSGHFACACCGAPLFPAATQYDSGSGWPSFWATSADGAVGLRPDGAHGMARTEVTCAACGAHLGHTFGDGPRPSGQRYCINSVCLQYRAGGEGGSGVGDGGEGGGIEKVFDQVSGRWFPIVEQIEHKASGESAKGRKRTGEQSGGGGGEDGSAGPEGSGAGGAGGGGAAGRGTGEGISAAAMAAMGVAAFCVGAGGAAGAWALQRRAVRLALGGGTEEHHRRKE